MGSNSPPPPRSSDGLRVPARAESSGQAAARSPSRSPSPRRRSPSTPGPVDDSAGEYFPSLAQTPSAAPSTAPSVRSRSSTRSTFRPPSSRPPSTRPPGSAASPAPPSPFANRAALEDVRQPSIRIRRNSAASQSSLGRSQTSENITGRADLGLTSAAGDNGDGGYRSGRPRSISQPERARVATDAGALARHSRRQPQVSMPRLTEEGTRPSLADLGVTGEPVSPARSLPEERTYDEEGPQPGPKKLLRRNKVSRMFWPSASRRQESEDERPPSQPPTDQSADAEYDTRLVDWLDTVDPEVQTLSTLTNVQNSLFVPDLGSWVNRRPAYSLSQHDAQQVEPRPMVEKRPAEIPEEPQAEGEAQDLEQAPPMQRTSTITSRLTESHYAALPHGTTLEGWSADEKWELDDHVRHMLHSRRSRFKRQLKGFGQYVRRPLGFFVTLYATLITLFGLAWVLFLIGWIYVGEEQVYAIHVIDSVLVALFAIMGDGLAPFRAVDTYHLLFVVRYSRMVQKGKTGDRPRSRLQKRTVSPEVREGMGQSALDRPASEGRHGTSRPPSQTQGPDAAVDWAVRDNSPNLDPAVNPDVDIEDAKSTDSAAEDPLTSAQRKSLEHHKKKLAKSHSFYKPEETFTHNPFPLGYLIAIVVLLDCHSCLQISLGACTWGIDYHTRPFALTTVILCVSITCNITAGLVITIGDRKTRKKDIVNLIDRQELTGDAIRHIEGKRKKEHEEKGEPGSDIPEVNLDALKEENAGLDHDSLRGSLERERKELKDYDV